MTDKSLLNISNEKPRPQNKPLPIKPSDGKKYNNSIYIA